MNPIEQALALIDEQIVQTETVLTAPSTEVELWDRLHKHWQLGRLRKVYRDLQGVLRCEGRAPAPEGGHVLDPFVNDYLGEDPR